MLNVTCYIIITLKMNSTFIPGTGAGPRTVGGGPPLGGNRPNTHPTSSA